MPTELRDLPIAELRESPRNPRQRFDETAMAELVQSVRSHGILTPLIVRPAPAKKGRAGGYEIAAGHRRFRAARAAGLERVPAIVRDLDDEAFVEVLNLENLQREDLHPLEEAEGYRQLLALPGRDVHQVAAAVGKSIKYVYDRVKLLDLEGTAREHFAEGRITAGHAILLARLEPAQQAEIVKRGLFTADHGHGIVSTKPVSVRELEREIDVRFRFERAAVDPLVYPETAETLGAAAEHAEQVLPISTTYSIPPEARADERTLCRQSWKRADGKPDPTDFPRDEKPSKECEHSVLGVVVLGALRGQAFRICTAKKECSVHWGKEPRAAAVGDRAKAGRAAAALRQKRLEERWNREAAENRRWNEASKAIEKALRELVAALPDEELVPGGKAAQILEETKVKGRTPADLVRGMLLCRRANWRAEQLRLGKILGVDVQAIVDRVAPKQPAEPKDEKRARKKPAAMQVMGRVRKPRVRPALKGRR